MNCRAPLPPGGPLKRKPPMILAAIERYLDIGIMRTCEVQRHKGPTKREAVAAATATASITKTYQVNS